MIYIFDIDGTLADISHRLHLIGASATTFTPYGAPKDWEAFYAACKDDKPIWEVITVARALADAGHIILYSTGRQESSKQATLDWLTKYRVPHFFAGLYMRKDGDHREDYVVKSELLDKIMTAYGAGLGGYGGAFEDRQQCVDMYRARGVRVFQVAKGDF